MPSRTIAQIAGFNNVSGRTMKSLLACLLLITTSGCGRPQADYSKVELVEVSGTIRLDDEPLRNAVVTFESPDSGTFSYGLTDADGVFEMQFDSVASGVTPGEKVVRISTAKKILGLNSSEEGGGEQFDETQPSDDAMDSSERVPSKYNQDSQLRVTVSPQETVFDFDLSTADE